MDERLDARTNQSCCSSIEETGFVKQSDRGKYRVVVVDPTLVRWVGDSGSGGEPTFQIGEERCVGSSEAKSKGK